MVEFLSEFLSSSIEFAGFTLTGEIVFLALAVIVSAFIIKKVSDFFIDRAMKKGNGDEHASVTAKKMSGYLVYSLGFVAFLGVLGLPLSALGAAVGLIGLGLSFALKDIIANFISGLLIMINRPFKIGDQINVEGESGTVQDIRVRATDIRTFDGRKMIVPNSKLYSDTVINNTAYDSRRFEVIVGVGYDEDVEKAKELAIKTLEEVENVESNPEPDVLVTELGDSSVNIKMRGWTKPSRVSLVQASSEVTQLVKQKYDEEGIDIPYPVRTVYMEE